MNVFSKVKECQEEQDEFFCPFCGAGYVCVHEFRTFVVCAACEGDGQKAREAQDDVRGVLNGLFYSPRTLLTRDLAEEYMRKLGPGHYRNEYKIFWRKLKQELGQ
jgi:hypothetical protein